MTPEMAVTEGVRLRAWTNGEQVSTASPFTEPTPGLLGVIGALFGCMFAVVVVLSEPAITDRITRARTRHSVPSLVAYEAI